MDDSSETPEFYPIYYLINPKTKEAQIERCDSDDLVKWFDKGYQVTDKRTYYESVDKYTDWHQARIRKTLLQRLRRQQGYNPSKRK